MKKTSSLMTLQFDQQQSCPNDILRLMLNASANQTRFYRTCTTFWTICAGEAILRALIQIRNDLTIKILVTKNSRSISNTSLFIVFLKRIFLFLNAGNVNRCNMLQILCRHILKNYKMIK